MARHWFFRLPIIRGIIALGESLAIGFRALAISANYAAQEEGEEDEEPTELSRGAAHLRVRDRDRLRDHALQGHAALITNWLPIDTTGWFVIVEGVIRVVDLHRSTWSLISLLPDLRRVFQYHAAEHKAINAYEAGDELEPEPCSATA